MTDNTVIALQSGEIYMTESDDDAFLVRSGKLLIYAVTETNGTFGKRSFIYEAYPGEVIPGFCYTDMHYRRHRFLFSAGETARLTVIRNGSTKKLRTGFLQKIIPGYSGEESFHEALTDRLRTMRVTDANFITRSEDLREKNAEDAEKLISGGIQRHAAGKKTPGRGKDVYRSALHMVWLSCYAVSPLQLAVFILSLTVSAGTVTGFLLFIRSALNGLSFQGVVIWLSSLLLLTVLIIFADTVTAKSVISKAAQKTQSTLFERFFALRHQYFRSEKTTTVAGCLLKAYRVFESVVSDSFLLIKASVLSIVCLVTAALTSAAPALTGLAVAAAALTVYGTALKAAAYRRRLARQAGEKADALLYQYTAGVIKMRMAGAEERAVLEYLRPVSEQAGEDEKARRYRCLSGSLSVFGIVLLALTLMMTAGVWKDNFADAAVCAAASSLSAAAGFTAVKAFSRICDRQHYPQRLQSVIDQYSESSPDGAPEISPDGDIVMDHVTFAYEPEGVPVLRDFSLHIRQGEFTAITGESGCGKSTVFRLLLGFETPQQGDILYSGINLSEAEISSLRRQTGVVLQDGKLIAGTIAENIALTDPTASKKDLMRAVRAAGLEEDLCAMPMGLNTLVSGNGEMFSGGQRQKILLARALLSSPKLLLLDEPTSALDNTAQKLITDTLEGMNVTRIVIAHRLSTIRGCDRIIVLKDGAVAEEGAYDELIRRGGVFSSLTERQIIS